ncbi:porin family protein [Marinirhabdus gelatinilytica]|uniref:Uncharacterized protein n=1 Tax=Marinirhabdus gelatinilytica TaxID=1703343 RepID=A0A370QIS8_9FLAO|nr:outer membrane beta-barrel protein [Marinirhabdus gelatinilytica]RDK88274.1 hypothetical protein C8D94_101143 [Marinirhabdus gelatinilytica]
MHATIQFIVFSILFCSTLFSFAQEDLNSDGSIASVESEKKTDTIVDLKYREDQFYLGITYNILSDVPSAVNLSGLSGGIHFGFLRDMPINKRRNIAIAIGAGLSFDAYGNTLFIGETPEEESIFTILTNDDYEYDFNRFSTAVIEAPIEFRWRNSTPTKYGFWRVYAGFRIGYAYWYRAHFSQEGNEVNQTDIPEFNQTRLAATLSFGYSKVNFYAYYSINPFFENAVTTNTQEEVGFKTFKVGLIFYIL